MKKIVLTVILIIMCAGVCIAATYKIKNGGAVVSPKNQTNQTTNLYNNYSSGQYVKNNSVNAQPAGIIDIVMDFSGSMSSTVQVAKSTMANVVSQIPSSTKIGFRVFGQGDFIQAPKMADIDSVAKTTNDSGKTVYKLKTKYKSSGILNGGSGCQATALVTPIASANANALISGMNSVELGGSTPMVLALQQAAYSDLGASSTTKKKIVLITDGGENCGGDPCAFARTLMSTRRDISIDVVLVSTSSKRLQCLAATTGGSVYNLSNANEFAKVLTQSINTPPGQNSNQTQYTPQEEPQQNYEFLGE